MTTVASDLAEAGHRFTRKGRDTRVRVIELPDRGDGGGHILVFGDIVDGCLVRVHSRCLYGEALRSDDCDCGPELDKSLDMIQEAGSGVLVYLEQEGRGAGLLAKARGYLESEQTGEDTFTSYERLGYPPDGRSYEQAARALFDVLNLRTVQLLTNNPAKMHALREVGLVVEVVPLVTEALSQRAVEYLDAKRRRRRHWIPNGESPWSLEQTILPRANSGGALPDGSAHESAPPVLV
ncbi:GTP cyclohydrolase II [Nocardia sp. bgisy118]|uniref:GTP cyclohydrolase II n=1 Tax=Nocardia sp. bgisy118 TaxID=3413786 RepID=UPI003F4A0E1C